MDKKSRFVRFSRAILILGITKNVVLYVYKDSKMHQYAMEKGYTCELIDEK